VEDSLHFETLRCASGDPHFNCKLSVCVLKHRVSTSICTLKDEAAGLPSVYVTMLTP